MAALQQAMVATLGEALYHHVAFWADDLIVYSKSMEEHVEHVDDVLRRLDENNHPARSWSCLHEREGNPL